MSPKDSHLTSEHAALVERVVREVLARLSPQGAPHTGEVVVTRPLLTLSDVVELSPTTQLRVPARAVITPAAKDALKDRGIRLVRGSNNGRAEAGSPAERQTADHMAASDVAGHAAEGPADDEQLARQVANAVERGESPIVTTARRPHRMCCLLNRWPHVRAAFIGVGYEAVLDEQGWHPNVLVAAITTPAPLLARWQARLTERITHE